MLTESCPYTLEVMGHDYDIDPSYRAALETFKAFASDELSDMEKAGIMVHNLFLGEENYSLEVWQGMVEKAAWFLRGGDETHEKPEKIPTVNFEFDNKRIYAAFKKIKVNLNDKITLFDENGEPELDENGKKILIYMHWWDYLAHFSELPECELSRIMYLRHLYNTGELNKKEHKRERKEAERIGWDIIKIKASLDDDFDWIK